MQPMTSKIEPHAMPFDETDVKDFKLFKGIWTWLNTFQAMKRDKQCTAKKIRYENIYEKFLEFY
jgi:hypothetical protein